MSGYGYSSGQVDLRYQPPPPDKGTARHLAKIEQAAMGQAATHQRELAGQHHRHQMEVAEAHHRLAMSMYAAYARGQLESANYCADMAASISGATCEMVLVKVLMGLEQTNGLPPGTLAHYLQSYRMKGDAHMMNVPQQPLMSH